MYHPSSLIQETCQSQGSRLIASPPRAGTGGGLHPSLAYDVCCLVFFLYSPYSTHQANLQNSTLHTPLSTGVIHGRKEGSEGYSVSESWQARPKEGTLLSEALCKLSHHRNEHKTWPTNMGVLPTHVRLSRYNLCNHNANLEGGARVARSLPWQHMHGTLERSHKRALSSSLVAHYNTFFSVHSPQYVHSALQNS